MNIWELDKLILFILFVVPGFVAIKAYEVLIPSQMKDSSKQIVDAITYSCINYALLFVPMMMVEKSNLSAEYPYSHYAFYFFVIFVSPILLVFSWKWLRTTNLAQNNAPHPVLKPWDYVFMQRRFYWVKVILKNGDVIGGLYRNKSFASSYPAPEQIFLEQTWIIGEKGGFERPKNDSAGIIILSDEIAYIELRNYSES